MASTKSLGLHKPTGLQYLYAEGLLPPSSQGSQYRWETYVSNSKHGPIEEELLYTRRCVVWSQAGIVCAVYRFELEENDVSQALLTSFGNEFTSKLHLRDDRHQHGPPKVPQQVENYQNNASHAFKGKQRALVVVLKTSLHIYFLNGPHHVVDLPFIASKAYPAPHGLLLSRRRTQPTPLLHTPRVPAAPPNSFFSSQPSVKDSYLQSPTLSKSSGQRTLTNRPTLSQDATFDDLWRQITAESSKAQDEEEDTIFTLSDPFSEPALVTEASKSPALRWSGRRQRPPIELASIDPSERVVYITPVDELQSSTIPHSPLVLMVSANDDRGTLTVWHGWYLQEHTLASLMKSRNEAKADKDRRRSSFLSASIGTGATTPAVRNRETLRESFVALSHLAPIATRNISGRDEEAVMASQLDPDFPIESTQDSTKEVSRRISSVVSRGEIVGKDPRVAQGTANASLSGAVYRRGPSFGAAHDRRSQGFRKSRGSTPGSILSRSVATDDDTMDFDVSSELDIEDAVTDSIEVMQASQEVAGAEAFMGAVDGSWKRDLVLSKLHVCTPEQIIDESYLEANNLTVTTLVHPAWCAKSENTHMTAYLHNRVTKELFSLSMQVKHHKSSVSTESIPVPVVTGSQTEREVHTISNLSDDGCEALLINGSGIRYPGSDTTCSIALPSNIRLHNPFSIQIDESLHKSVGRNRTTQAQHGLSNTLHAGISGRIDKIHADGSCHRQAIRISASDRSVSDILDLCEIVLPQEMACAVRPTWLFMREALTTRPKLMTGTVCSIEAIAATAVVFTRVLRLLDEKSKAALRVSRVSTGRQSAIQRSTLALQQPDNFRTLASSLVWAHMNDNTSEKRTNTSLDQALPIAIALADESSVVSPPSSIAQDAMIATKLMLGLHILAEERKLYISSEQSQFSLHAAIVAQLGQWLNLDAWMSISGSYYELGGASMNHWKFIKSNAYRQRSIEIMETPIGVCEWLDHSITYRSAEQYPTLAQVAQLGNDQPLPASFITITDKVTPRLTLLSRMLKLTQAFTVGAQQTVEAMWTCGITNALLESLPEGLSTPMKEAVTICERNPPGAWPNGLLRLVGRDDLVTGRNADAAGTVTKSISSNRGDVQSICNATELPSPVTKTREADRNAISQLIFNEDRRLVDAAGLLHYNTVQIAECQKQPEWNDTYYFEQQRRVMQFVTIRMIALPIGDGMLHFNSQSPLMTEKYHLPGFSSSCMMQPIGHTVTTDRSGLTEEKVNWAYFHAGVSAGLRISKNTTGIDTSWLVFNKPNELTNRHAGLLLALGLNGHLKNIAKWLSFKYLTPKHTMTSLGLLLGLAASHLGSMDGLITRMLSVHINCMLPPGAAELNVSPLTQAAGLLGIGLLYYNTQHRRMTETMLEEIEANGMEDADCGPDTLRDESYRLAAGFSLGLINLGRSKNLRGLQGMQLQERLLRVAVGPKPVHAVHVFDKATAGATMAIALVYMKSGDTAVARQIDVPDSEAQFEHVRPDMLMLRCLAKHIILWDTIQASTPTDDGRYTATWIPKHLPKCCRVKWQDLSSGKAVLKSFDLPVYYIVTGLALAMSLKYAGSGHRGARNEILAVLDMLWNIQKRRTDVHFYYDTKMARSAVRRCIDALVLAAATVMSGTGDIETFRYLRRLHGRTDAETPYGSHLASHMGIGLLFLGGGTYTLGTSDLAIASLVCSLYPLFPIDVHDNKVHLQAFRHLWVFAVEPRCLVVEDIDSGRPVSMPILITSRDGTSAPHKTPCLLPDLAAIASIATTDPAYWRVELDFASNDEHVRKFREDQKIYVRRCPASEAYDSTFWATFAALTANTSEEHLTSDIRNWVFSIPAFKDLDRSDIELILPPDRNSSLRTQSQGTKVDDRLVLAGNAGSEVRDRLWDLRVLMAWASRTTRDGGESRWLGQQLLSTIECAIDERRRALSDG